MAVHITTASVDTDNESNFYSYDDCQFNSLSCMMGPVGVF